MSQTVQGSISYDAFGLPNATTGSSTSAYMFGATSGYRSDGDSGLILVGCRYYDPQVDRFVTRDTYLDQHPYLYCDGDPVNYLDPSGHQKKGKTPFPWPWMGMVHITLIYEVSGELGGVGGKGGLQITVDIDPKVYWPTVPPKDQDNLRRRPAKDYVRYINDRENKGK